jgi:TPR repeat protein
MEFEEYCRNFPDLIDIVKYKDDADESLLGVAVTVEKKTKKFFEYKMHLCYFLLTQFFHINDLVDDLRVPILSPLALLYNNDLRNIAVHYYDNKSFFQAYSAYKKMPYKLNDGVALYRLGYMLKEGGINLETNHEKSAVLLEKAFHLLKDHEGPQEIFTLGYMYRNAIFVEFDLDKAVELYQRSAKLGYPAAQNNLGVILEKGEIDGKPDIKAAYEFFTKAADKGLSTGINNKTRLQRRFPTAFPTEEVAPVALEVPEELL